MAVREHLHLVELVDAEDPPGVLAVRAGLPPEAGRDPAEPDRQVRFVEDLAGQHGPERHLRRAGEREVLALDAVDHLLVEAGAAHHADDVLAPDQNGRDDGGEPLGGQPVDRVPDERQLEQRAVPAEEVEPRSGDLGAALHVEEVEGRAQLDMVSGRELELRRGADHAKGNALVRPAVRHRGVGRVGDLQQHRLQRGVGVLQGGFQRLHLGGDLLHLGDPRLPGRAGQFRDLLRGPVLRGPQRFYLLDDLPAASIRFERAVDQAGVGALFAQRGLEQVGLFADQLEIDHARCAPWRLQYSSVR